MQLQAESIETLENSLSNQRDQLNSKTQDAEDLRNMVSKLEKELNQKMEEIAEHESINETLHVQVEQENIQKNKLSGELKEAQEKAANREEAMELAKKELEDQIQNLKEEMIKNKLDSDCQIQCLNEQNKKQLATVREEHQQALKAKDVEFDEQTKIQDELNMAIQDLQLNKSDNEKKIKELQAKYEEKEKEL